jgi:hypothetical protein
MRLLDGRSHRNLAALVFAALLLPGLRAFAQTPDGDEFGDDKAKPAKPAKSTPSAEPEAPADAVETTPPVPAAVPPAAPEAGPYVGFAPEPSVLRIENPNATIQFGILAQPQFEMAGSPDAILTTKNLFLRRLRFMVGGTIFKTLEFFMQTDWPDLFKLDPVGTMAFDKNSPGMNIQDAFVTWKPLGELFKFDAGFMLPPVAHNSLESAAKLYGPDYFTNSFRRNFFSVSDRFGSSGQSPQGRDAGVQARFLLWHGHIDARVGLFQGHRSGAVPAAAPNPATVGGINMFRVAGRVQINLLDAEPGYFYQGTYLGRKKIVSFGGFYDFQDDYKYFGGDFLVDLPVGPGIFTAQGNVVQWDGGTFITLTKQRAYMGEMGYLIGPLMLSPIAHFERLVSYTPMPDPAVPSEDRYGGGLAFWPYGHNSSIKVFFLRVHRNPSPADYNQINVQWQVYVY